MYSNKTRNPYRAAEKIDADILDKHLKSKNIVELEENINTRFKNISEYQNNLNGKPTTGKDIFQKKNNIGDFRRQQYSC